MNYGKIVCIHNPHKVWNITPGKIYDLQQAYSYFDDVYIVDDKDEEMIFSDGLMDISLLTNFISIDEFRDKQLKKLGI